jgi:hypothetical protein
LTLTNSEKSVNSKTQVDWFDRIPIAVNDSYGDPFIIEQVDNTIYKVKELMNHKATIALFTKAPFNNKVLEKLKEIAHNPRVVVYYSLTGLDEGGYSFENRVEMIKGLNAIFKNVAILTRPIIKKRNDSPELLQKIVNVAKEHTSGYLVLGGVHDKYKKKSIDFSVENMLIEMCDKAGVKSFHKTSCCAAYIHGKSCWSHDLGEPINISVARELGYQIEVIENKIILPEATTGDLNFLQLLTRAEVYAEKILSNYNLLTIKTGDQKYESTSSFFDWTTNINTCIDCDYCIIKQIEYLNKNQVSIGTHPREMIALIKENSTGIDLSSLKFTKLKKEAVGIQSYKDVRVTKPCFVPRYAPLGDKEFETLQG